MSTYLTACLLVYSTLRLTIESHSPSFDLNLLPARTDPRLYCQEIISSAGCLLNPSTAIVIRHSLIFSVGITFTYLGATENEAAPSPEMQHITRFFEAGEQGIRMRKFFFSMLRSGPASFIDLDTDESEEEFDVALFKIKARAWFGMDLWEA